MNVLCVQVRKLIRGVKEAVQAYKEVYTYAFPEGPVETKGKKKGGRKIAAHLVGYRLQDDDVKRLWRWLSLPAPCPEKVEDIPKTLCVPKDLMVPFCFHKSPSYTASDAFEKPEMSALFNQIGKAVRLLSARGDANKMNEIYG
jgi:hypothetical protein